MTATVLLNRELTGLTICFSTNTEPTIGFSIKNIHQLEGNEPATAFSNLKFLLIQWEMLSLTLAWCVPPANAFTDKGAMSGALSLMTELFAYNMEFLLILWKKLVQCLVTPDWHIELHQYQCGLKYRPNGIMPLIPKTIWSRQTEGPYIA